MRPVGHWRDHSQRGPARTVAEGPGADGVVPDHRSRGVRPSPATASTCCARCGPSRRCSLQPPWASPSASTCRRSWWPRPIIVTDLVNFIVPTADVGGAVWSLLDRLIDGDPGTIAAIALDPAVLGHPGCPPPRRSCTCSSPGDCDASVATASRSGWAPDLADPSDPEEVAAGRTWSTELAVAAGIEPPRSSCTTTVRPTPWSSVATTTTRRSSSVAACWPSSIARRRRASSRGSSHRRSTAISVWPSTSGPSTSLSAWSHEPCRDRQPEGAERAGGPPWGRSSGGTAIRAPMQPGSPRCSVCWRTTTIPRTTPPAAACRC